jgi:hypothetical protein
MSRLITKSAVLEAKEKGAGMVNYEDVGNMSGDNLAKKGISSLGEVLKRNKGVIGKAVGKATKMYLEAVRCLSPSICDHNYSYGRKWTATGIPNRQHICSHIVYENTNTLNHIDETITNHN